MISPIFRGHICRFPRTKRRAGYTTLEFAVALPVILAFLLGAIDLTALIQGYTALREGVRQGVRCVATTDGKCVGITPASATPLFHWYRLEGGAAYIADRLDLRGHGYWLKQPTYRYTEAQVLDSVRYTVPVTDYTATRWVYPATQALRYNVRESRGAYVTGASPRSPSFVFKNAQSISYPSEVVVSHAVNEELSPSRRSVTITTAFSTPLPDIPCYRSMDLDDGPQAQHHPTESPCNPNRIPAIVYVRGAARGNGHGALTLSIDGRHIANTDFGGQQFDVNSSSWQSRNFVPRGVAPGYVTAAFNGEPEYALYAEAITLARGETVSVTVSIAPGVNSWTDPAMRYRVTEIRIVPAIVRSIETTTPCPNGVARGDYLRGTVHSCGVPYPSGALGAISVDTSQNLSSAPPREFPSILSAAHLASTFTEVGLDQLDYITRASSARSEERTNRCPENMGVPYPANSAGEILDPATATTCPVVDEEMRAYEIAPQAVRWSERTIPLPQSARFSWTKRDCSHEEPLPVALMLYPKPVRKTVENDLFPELPDTPLSPRYGCDEFHLQHTVFDDESNGGTAVLPAHSLFLGLHVERTESCLTHELKNDAVTNGGLDPRAYFALENHRIDAVYLTGAPADTCSVFRAALRSPNGRTHLTATGPLPYGERPAECATTPCVAELVGLSSGGRSEITADTDQAAAYWGYNEVRSLYPRAKWGCSGAECVSLHIEDGEIEVVGRGSITVPVRTLLGREVTLTFADQRPKELSFAQ